MIAKDGARVTPSEDASRRSVDVALSGAGPFAGQLRIQTVGGGEAARIVAGQRCAGVARAVALLVAIALQDAPSEQLDVSSVTPPEPISPDPAESTTAATADSEAAAPPEYSHDPWPPPLPEPPPEPPADASRDSPSTALSQRRGWHLALSAAGGLSSEEGPLLRPNVVAYVEAFLNRAGSLSPSLRLGIEKDPDWNQPTTGTLQEPNGVTQYYAVNDTVRKTAARVDVCPLRWIAKQPWADDMLTAQPCARIDVGEIDVVPSVGSAESHPWASTGLLLRTRWVLSTAFLEAEGGVMFPLVTGAYPGGFGPVAITSAPAATLGIGGGFLAL
jgi:hypothetical protein